MDESSASVWVAVIGVMGVIVGSVIAGSFARDRWPHGLSDARRLGELIEKMDKGTAERQLAAEHRDDLIAAWVFARTSPAAENWRSFAVGASALLTVLTIAIAVGVPVLVVFSATAYDIPYNSWWPLLLALLIMWAPTLALFVAAILGWEKRWNAHLDAVRESRGMRRPLTKWLKTFERDRRSKPGRRQGLPVSLDAEQDRPAPSAAD